MEYNTQLPHLIIPEYGRNIQVMIDHCITIEDRDERNKCARAIIQIMGQVILTIKIEFQYLLEMINLL